MSLLRSDSAVSSLLDGPTLMVETRPVQTVDTSDRTWDMVSAPIVRDWDNVMLRSVRDRVACESGNETPRGEEGPAVPPLSSSSVGS